MQGPPAAKAGAIARVLLRNGFVERKAKGSHRLYQKPGKERITLSFHGAGAAVPPHEVRRIARCAGKDLSEFR